MRHQEIELLVTILAFLAVLFIAYRSNKGGKKFDPKDYYSGAGQFFDNGSYVGNTRSIIFAILFIYIGGNADAIAKWIYLQFGETLTVSPGKEAWHRVIASVMGILIVFSSLRNMKSIYAKNKQNLSRSSEGETEEQKPEDAANNKSSTKN